MLAFLLKGETDAYEGHCRQVESRVECSPGTSLRSRGINT